MNSDEVLAELDAQYQELIQSVQLEGLSQDDVSEQSGQQQIDILRKASFQNVGEIIRKYEQTLQTSRGKINILFLWSGYGLNLCLIIHRIL